MRRILFVFLLGLCFGAFAYSGIAPQYAFAAPHITSRQVVITVHAKHEVQSKIMDDQPDTIYTLSETQTEMRLQNSLKLSWPLSLPDFSFLWTQPHSDQKKDPYNRGQ